MAISSSGVISGLDVASLVKASMVYDRLPLDRMQKQLTKTESQISAMGQIKSAVASLQEAAKALSNSSDLYSYKASLSNADIATVTASGKAAAGAYSVEVTQLATSHKLASAVGLNVSAGGSLTIGAGSKSAAVTIGAGATLSDLAKAINDSDAGVSATVINGGQPTQQLVLTSRETGAANQITLSSTDISALNYDPASPGSWTEKEKAQDAKVTIDGIALANTPSNTITDALTGVDLTLKEVGKTQLTLSNDPADFETKLKTFVDAYNKARSTMKDLSSYDAKEKTAAALNGDSSVSSAMNQLRGLFSAIPEDLDKDDPRSSLANLGIETSAAGVLSINSSKLKSAMETDFASVAKTVAAYGSAFDKLTTQMNSSDGLITSRLSGLNSTTSRLNDSISTQERRLELVQARYEKQFANLETLLSSMTSTSNYLTQQLASLNRLSG